MDIFKNIIKEGNSVITLTTVMDYLLKDKAVNDIMAEFVDVDELKAQMNDILAEEKRIAPDMEEGKVNVTPLVSLFRKHIVAIATAEGIHPDKLNAIDYLAIFLSMNDKGDFEYYLDEAGAASEDIFTYILTSVPESKRHVFTKKMMPPEIREVISEIQEHPEVFGPAIRPHSAREKNNENEFPFLTNMIEQAKEYTLPFIGREDIIERTIMILNRKVKHNVIHLGEPGVGKTVCTIGLAKMIIEEKVPPVLKGAEVYSLDIGNLIAGTKYRGELEDKLTKAFKYLNELGKNVVLYIDEIHLMIGAGASSGSSVDIANLLKPYLSSADSRIRVIGATTREEYRKYIEKDKAFCRRFQTIDVLEPSVDEAKKILNGLKPAFEKYHKVSYSKEAIDAAVELSAKYINDKFLPDKAIDIIDETASRLSIAGVKKVGKTDIQDTVSKIAKIPSENVSETENEKLAKLNSSLSGNVFGQEEAIRNIVAAINMSKAGLNEDNKPIASFLFVGPTGVGKTEVAKTLANTLGIPLVRFDMSEYMDKTAMNKLIGTGSGYVGYEDGGLFVNAIKDTPHCVLLLDEFEKAHPDMCNLLLQVMDNATLTDNKGRVADFRNVIIIMTSNAGARDMDKASIGFGHANTINVSAMDDAVKRMFSPEFRNRLTSIVKFNSMSKEMAREIAAKQLRILSDKLSAKKVKIKYSDAVVDSIVEKAQAVEMGGREVIRVVDKQIKPLFVNEILFGALANGGSATVSTSDEGFAISCSAKKKSTKTAKNTETATV